METWTANDDVVHRAGRFTPVALAELAAPRQESVAAGAFKAYAPITVHLNGEISVRKRATPYKGAMFAANPGDIVFSKIDARSGAIGVVPTDIGPAVVTPEFPVFMPDLSRLDATFMRRILRTGELLNALSRKASGTSGRKRVTPTGFLSIAIPLPPIEEQRALVAAYDAALSAAAALEVAAATAEADGLAAFEAELGLAAPTPLPDVPRFIAKFSAMDRWSHEAVLRLLTVGGDDTGKHPIVRLGDVIADLENGWSPKCLTRPAQADEWGVLKLGAVSFGVFNPDENKALPPSLKSRPSLEVKPGDMLISRANVVRLVGATAYVETVRPRLLLCDKIFRAVPMADSRVDLTFIAQVLRIPAVRWQIESKLTGTSPTMKNIAKPALLSLTFPLPTDIAEQRSLIAALELERAKASVLRQSAKAKRVEAWAAFETAIYGV